MEMTLDKSQQKSSFLPMAIVAALFFILGFATWLNGSLMPYLKQILQLNPFQASLILFSFYIAVTFTALPSAWLIRKVGYKNGMAIGIGTTLLMHCDLVYVSRDARLRMPFVNLGLCPEFGSSLILPRLLGHAKAAELLLLGEGFSGEQAAAWGIATEALGSGEAALTKAREMALRFESLPPEAVRISKQLMKAPDREQLRTVIEEEGALFTQRLRSPEAMAALSAFISRH